MYISLSFTYFLSNLTHTLEKYTQKLDTVFGIKILMSSNHFSKLSDGRGTY